MRGRALVRLLTLAGFAVLAGPPTAVAAAAATAASTNLATFPPPPLPEAGLSLLRVCGALSLVIALFLAGVWLFRNWHRVTAQRGPQQLRILESRSLGGRHALHVVGYQGQRLLLASSPGGISLVSHLPAAIADASDATASAPGVPPPSGLGPSFVHVLQEAIQKKS